MRYIITAEVDEKNRYSADVLIVALEMVSNSFRLEKEYNCDICEDTGEVTTMEPVYAGEPHVAPIGTRVCTCKLYEDEYTGDE